MQDNKEAAKEQQALQPQDKQPREIAPVQFQTTQIQYSGPIPPAAEMAHYARVNTDLPERIMALAEKQSEHRQKIETIHVSKSETRQTLGIVFAFIFSLTVIACGTICILRGKDASGFKILLGGLLPLVAAFLYEKKQKR